MLNQVAIWFQEKSEIELQYQDPKRSTACRHSKIDQEFYAESHENVSVAGAIREWSSHFVYSSTLHGLQHLYRNTMDSPRPLDCASFTGNVVLFISDIYVAKEVFQLPGHD